MTAWETMTETMIRARVHAMNTRTTGARSTGSIGISHDPAPLPRHHADLGAPKFRAIHDNVKTQMSDKEWALKPEFEYLRTAKLVWLVCPVCKRGSYWARLPAKCGNNGCIGIIDRSKQRGNEPEK